MAEGVHKITADKPVVGVYSILSPTGKIYVGQSRNMKYRKQQYKGNAVKNQVYIYRSIAKYGWEPHQFTVEKFFDDGVEQSILNAEEYRLWKHYKDAGVEMLNLKQPGNQAKQAEETKRKIGMANRGKHTGNNLSKKMLLIFRDRMIGNKFRVGCTLTDAHKLAIANAARNKVLSAESHLRLSQAKLGHKNPMFGKPLSEEHRKKISEGNRNRIITPEMRLKMSLGGKKRWEGHVDDERA